MGLLSGMSMEGHEQLIAFQDAPSGLRGFLAIHSTRLGPAMGGIRFWRYEREEDALADALRLSHAMSYKAALAGLNAGGGKAVILDHPELRRREAFEAFGRLVESLAGRFFTGPDVGVTDQDLATARRITRYVVCHSSPELGDLNELTALGVWERLVRLSGIRWRQRQARRHSRRGWGGHGSGSHPAPPRFSTCSR